MTEKIVDVSSKYNHELLEIQNKLQQLENGRVYELTHVQTDGYLSTNANQLKKMIASLLNKIEYEKDSINDEMGKAFKNMGK